MVEADTIFIHQLRYQPHEALLRLGGEIPLVGIPAGVLHGSIGIAHSALDTDRIEVGTDPMEGMSAGALQATTAVPDHCRLRISRLIDGAVALDVIVAAISTAVQIRVIRIRDTEVMHHDKFDLVTAPAPRHLGEVLLRDIVNGTVGNSDRRDFLLLSGCYFHIVLGQVPALDNAADLRYILCVCVSSIAAILDDLHGFLIISTPLQTCIPLLAAVHRAKEIGAVVCD